MTPIVKQSIFLLLPTIILGIILVFGYGEAKGLGALVQKDFLPRLYHATISVNSSAPIYGYQIIHHYPHDPRAFTQGLIFNAGFLYESTGQYGQSTVRKVALETGIVLQQYTLPSRYFGEGLTLWQDKLIQLTWQEKVGFVYDQTTFSPLHEFFYPTEGWGITHDSQHLIMSDGSSTLYFLDPKSFQLIKRLPIHDGTTLVTQLNELEYVKGEIYANVWLTHYIARISPETGQILGWINLAGLLNQGSYNRAADVLNGIAYDEQQDRLFVTGKYWPSLFEIKLTM
ncbi:glutamine cyclotransferase [Candidatus Nitrosoglobus terrae]|uniref:Glutamine cyclotransferase n=1 Tax=Candidatus Nitrosoglobus terrae TaxID=1630141 RepID=A0A1Q2SM76_9GAMM|nr:glutaminyl-peptide cyclotransferase [Candidatus Nitrosoglobus terrae]BAW80222.1 glutamine cyclotransferase [Candidatus Nitrosoglobus terrae]